MHVLLADGSIPWMLVAGIVAGLALALLAGWPARLAHRSVRALLHPLAGADGRLAIYLRAVRAGPRVLQPGPGGPAPSRGG
ncbi:MAG: hypothetical protein IPG75_15040 [Gemmatimonadetes bacterium]|nr:hypothetical protein [Gemmatimonadota bacterium]